MEHSSPNGTPQPAIITLLTDFGLKDPYVGVMKGVMLSINPLVRFVDLTHDIHPQAIRQGAFALDSAWSYFPKGTIHLAVVDPGVGSTRAPMILAAGGHLFVGPDNGLFSLQLDRWLDSEAFNLSEGSYRLPEISQTFHGRDIFAPAAAWASRGVPISAFGPLLRDPVRTQFALPRQSGAGWCGEVVYVDRFGNLVTNLPAEVVASHGIGAWSMTIGGHAAPSGTTFSTVGLGELVAVVGSFNLVEIAVNGGSAAEHLKLGEGALVQLQLDPD